MKTRTGFLFVWSLVVCSFVGAQPRTPRPEIACQGHADGLYVMNPQACNDGFYKCANGRSYYYQCPTGLFFSTEDAQCEYKQTIPACGGVRPAQPAVQQPVAPVAAVHQIVAHAIPAQPINPIYPISYVQSPAPAPQAPVAPVEQPQYAQPTQPPPTTTYTPPTAPAYTTQAPAAAPAPIAVETTTPQVYQPTPAAPVAPVYQPPVQYVVPVVVESPTTPAPLYNQYAQPTAPALSSPVALVASPSEYVASTQAPYVAPTTPPTTPPAPIAPAVPSYSAPSSGYQQAAQPAAPQAAVRPAPPPVDFNCGANADGYYFKQPCTSNYYSCVGGQATKLTCPASLVYDPQVKGCDYADVCGKPRPPPTTTQKPPYTPPPSTACVGKPDGFYVKTRCASSYLHCTNNVAYELTCPAQLAFDGQQCIYREDCLNPTTPPAPVAPIRTSPAPPRSQWCKQNNKPDGTHGSGCTSKFYACGGGFTTEINCPAGLVYDQTTQSCDQRQFVPACGGVRPASTTTIAAPVAPVRPVNYNCAGKADGYHGSGCASSYYSCIGGQAGELACPAGTRYSSQLHTCDWPQNVPECGGRLPTSTVAAPVAPVAQNSYAYAAPIPTTPAAPIAVQQPQYAQPTQPPPTTTYTPPTAPVYTQPPATTQAPVYQPPATTQAPTTPAPVYQPPSTPPAPVAPVVPVYQSPSAPVAVVAPVYQSPPAPVALAAPVYELPVAPVAPVYQAPASSAAPVYSPPLQQPIAPIAPVASPDDYDANPCEKLPDGIYGRRCSRHYFVCSVSKTYEFTCPRGMAYDKAFARCGPKSGIPQCSSATAVAPASQAAVSPYSSG